MSEKRRFSRRGILGYGLSAAAGLAAIPLLQACGGSTATPTTAPAAKSTTAPAAAATTAPASGASSSPTGAATAAATGTTASGTATTGSPTAAAKPTGAATGAASSGATGSPTAGTAAAGASGGPTAANWTPETIRAQAGTLQSVDTKSAIAKVAPLDSKGRLVFAYAGPNQASPDKDKEMDAAFWQAWNSLMPGVPMKVGDNVQNVDYGQLLDKMRTAAAGNAAPDTIRFPILWGVEFAAKGMLSEINLQDFGYQQSNFWPGALKSDMWKGKLYGIPTNNETMAIMWNKKLFQDAGLDPTKAPATWADVVTYSKAIKDKTGKGGFGLLARPNHGNTPFRFMPMLWAYGGGALDEAEPNPTYEKVLINNEGSIQALQLCHDMYVRDKSVPTSALTNTNTENADLFIAGQVAMMISHPSEWATLNDRASKAQGADKERAMEAVNNTMYGLIPAGPVRRAVVFGGSNFHIFNDKFTNHQVPRQLANAFGALLTGPEWSTRLNWAGSNPGHLDGFKTTWMKERIDTIKFLENTSSMLPYGVPFPVIPESTQIMNNIVPDMLQNALTGKMSVKQAADTAAEAIQKVISQRRD